MKLTFPSKYGLVLMARTSTDTPGTGKVLWLWQLGGTATYSQDRGTVRFECGTGGQSGRLDNDCREE